MNILKSISRCPLRAAATTINKTFVRERQKSPCSLGLESPHTKDCFDIRNVDLVIAKSCNAPAIKCFLNTHYWPREPTVAALWMSLDSPYLQMLTDKYSETGHRLLAFENVPRTGERKLVGIAICNPVYPWAADELEEWAHYTCSRPERNRMYFCAHCIKAPKLCAKYKCEYVNEIEILGTAAEVTGQGVGKLLLRQCLQDAFTHRQPCTQMIATSAYVAKMCAKLGMKREWGMSYSEYVDERGQKVFYPRRPHTSVEIYSMPYDVQAALSGDISPTFGDS